MLHKRLFYLEAGSFFLDTVKYESRAKVELFDPDLRIPFTSNVLIGTPETEEEADLTHGTPIAYPVQIEDIPNHVVFLERPSYNGRKLILPHIFNFHHMISGKHAQLEMQLTDYSVGILYTHLSEEGHPTRILNSKKGIERTILNHGEQVDLDFPSKDPSQVVLLFGGSAEGNRQFDMFGDRNNRAYVRICTYTDIVKRKN
jgi:hypothetical protein